MSAEQQTQGSEQPHDLRLIPIDSSTSNQPNNAGLQTLSVDQQFIVVDGRLFDAIALVEDSRKVLHNNRAVLSTAEAKCNAFQNAFKDEQLRRRECALAYRALHDQHKKTINEMTELSNKHLHLQQELQGAQLTIRTYESTMRDGNDSGVDAKEHNIATIKRLEARSAELEQEKSKMAQEHQNALRVAADCILASEGKIKELEDKLCQGDRQRSMQMTHEEPIPSPTIGKRQVPCQDDDESNTQQGGAPAKKGRRRKQIAKEDI